MIHLKCFDLQIVNHYYLNFRFFLLRYISFAFSMINHDIKKCKCFSIFSFQAKKNHYFSIILAGSRSTVYKQTLGGGCFVNQGVYVFFRLFLPVVERKVSMNNKPEALKSLYRSPGYKKNQLVLCKNYVLQW